MRRNLNNLKMNYLLNIITDPGASATLLSVTVVIGIYFDQKRKIRMQAARLIYQEIRRAQNIIKDYLKHGEYRFVDKIFPNNSWKESIHLFARDFTIDEIDRITDLYVAGEYLDNLVQKISDFTFDQGVNTEINRGLLGKLPPENENENKLISVKIGQTWRTRLEIVTAGIDLVETPILSKLSKISKYKG